ncbi:unnamed protein product [Enterobius vermicularis]|uniref:ABC transporter permease n=1 Tax=Enterobius vermicularis TaxID=51028 RepID=A0A0N4UU21_ENTVE|nr:unnamed protein product [Enterobius vermicularis]
MPPLVLRQGWLDAIGRTEETVVSQVRFICSPFLEHGLIVIIIV